MLYVSVSRFGELQAIVARIVTPIQRLHELFFEFLRLVVASGASCLATPLSGLWICVFEVPVTPALIRRRRGPLPSVFEASQSRSFYSPFICFFDRFFPLPFGRPPSLAHLLN